MHNELKVIMFSNTTFFLTQQSASFVHFKKINKNDELLARLIKEKEKKTNYNFTVSVYSLQIKTTVYLYQK